MFPAINLSFKDPALKKLNLWVHNELHILICPFCSHYMEPYWIIHDDDSVTIKGGNKDDGEILQNIVTPYEARKIKLMPLTESDYPIDSERERGLVSRQVGEGVYHQIGGLPIKGSDISIHCCECNDEMKFMGILDYDDLNIPLYENNMEPVSLIIGDYDCLNFYSCNKCGVVGLSWAR